jgi:small subunit ribosomal protein S4e
MACRVSAQRAFDGNCAACTQAPRPSAGPHKLRECLPLIIFIRNRLKYALTYAESKWILKERQVKVDGKVRTDLTYPAGLMGA